MSCFKNGIVKLYISLLLSALGLIWFSQQSINAYWQQTYHQSSPLEYLDRYHWWRLGVEWQHKINGSYAALLSLMNVEDISEKEMEIAQEPLVLDAPENKTELAPHLESEIPSEPISEQSSGSELVSQQALEHKSIINSAPGLINNALLKNNLFFISQPLLENKLSFHAVYEQASETDSANEELAKNEQGENTSSMNKMPGLEITQPVINEDNHNIKLNEITESQNKENNDHIEGIEQLNSPPTEGISTKNDNPINAEANINENVEVALSSEHNKIILQKNDKVFFAGDSLMQGVAPFVQKYLKQHYGINSINLSKQSTGLAYPSFFDWPKTIEQTIIKDPSIRVLVMFLGPNDPWDMPNPEGGKYIKFKTPEWEQIYQSRIERILSFTQSHNVKVIWLGIPYMKTKKLNEGMVYLNQLLEKTLSNNVFWLPTNGLLSNNTNNYVDSIIIDQKMQRVRSKDGIHFTLTGQKILAEYIQGYFLVN